jgi:hypothetical protein
VRVMQPPPVFRPGGLARPAAFARRATSHRCSCSGRPPPTASTPIPRSAAPAFAVLAGTCIALADSWAQYDPGPLRGGAPHDTSQLPVTVVIPALNEEASIEACLRSVDALRPRAAAVVVAVGPSDDRTAERARAFGARVVRGARGRVRSPPAAPGPAITEAHLPLARAQAVQLNAGATAAPPPPRLRREHAQDAFPPPPAALLFVHADSRLPPDAVTLVRAALAPRDVVAGGFFSLIESGSRTWWFQSVHNGASRPAAGARGARGSSSVSHSTPCSCSGQVALPAAAAAAALVRRRPAVPVRRPVHVCAQRRVRASWRIRREHAHHGGRRLVPQASCRGTAAAAAAADGPLAAGRWRDAGPRRAARAGACGAAWPHCTAEPLRGDGRPSV